MEQTVASVNGTPIDSKSLAAAMQSLAREQFHAGLEDVPQAAHAELRAMALERLIARELIFQAALAEGFVADEADVSEESARILRMTGNPADFWARLAERGMDPSAFLRMVRKDVTVDRMSQQRLEQVEEPPEAEIREFFSAHPERLRERERVRVSHILIAVDPEDPAAALAHVKSVRECAERDGFAEVAKRHSVCASAPGGGELGFIRREEVDPTFAEAAFSQPVGEIGPPVKTPYGYHLIKVTAREIPAPPTFEESRDRIVAYLKKARGTKLLESWVNDLRREAAIVIHDR